MEGEGFTDSALHSFLYLYSQDTNNANLAYHIGNLYLKTSTHKANSLPYLEKAVKKVSTKYLPDDPFEKNAPPLTYYCLGRAQHLNYQFDNAITNFNTFKRLLSKKDARQDTCNYLIACCNNGKILMQSPVACNVINIGDSINGPYPDYCPILTADEQELLFTSRRPALGDSTKDFFGNYYEDIWISYARNDGNWTTAKDIGPPVNTGGNDATVSLLPDGQTLLFYNDNNNGDGNIFVSYYRGTKWTTPQLIDSSNSGVINSKFREPSATLSPDAQTLYFVSDRPGGFGGTDIYRASLQTNGAWGNPVNLGPNINTAYDEDAPYLHPDDSTLFFSSRGHNTMGGFDVFSTRLLPIGKFDSVKNLGYPINTPDDDIYFTLSADGRRAYYSSVRPGGYGEKDIYEVKFSIPYPVIPVAVLVGYLKTPNGNSLPGDVSVITTQGSGGKSLKTAVNPKTGKFLQVLRPNTSYKVVIASHGDTVFNQQFYLPSDSSYAKLSRSFFRTSIIMGDTTNVFVPRKKQPIAANVSTKDMKGQLLDDDKKPIPMVKIQLVDEKDSVLFTTITDDHGYFTFKKLDPNKNYVLKVDANDTRSKKLKNLYLADKDGRIVRDFDIHKKGNYFYDHLPASLEELQALAFENVTDAKGGHDKNIKQQKSENYSRDTASMPKSDADFTRYFAYNVDRVSADDADFKTLIDNIAAKASGGAITITVKGSASKVPAGGLFQHSNSVLATLCAQFTWDLIRKALKEKGVDVSKIKVKVRADVEGPVDLGDASDQVKYEKFQFVKVYIQ